MDLTRTPGGVLNLSKRAWAAVLALGLLAVPALVFLFRHFDAAQPRGISVTRADVRRIADAEARRWGIPVEASWVVIAMRVNYPLEGDLARDPGARRVAASDPVLGPRLGSYRVTYFRKGLEKFPEHGYVLVGFDGTVLGARKRFRPEESAAKPTAAELRPKADQIVAEHTFPGAPNPVYESVRPAAFASRTEHAFRYSVERAGLPPSFVYNVALYFSGDRWTGWELSEDYKDGRAFRYQLELAGVFGRMAAVYGVLFAILVLFLRKYHAGEVGVRTGGALFLAYLALSVGANAFSAPHFSFGMNFGGTDAFWTAVAQGGFRFLFFDVPLATLVFLAWTVGESYARERWGHRLASFDALVRFDPFNATVGRSILFGFLAAPAIAVSALALPLVPSLLGWARLSRWEDTEIILSAVGGPFSTPLRAASDSLALTVTGILFGLAWASRHLKAGILGPVLATVAAAVLGSFSAPLQPEPWTLTGAAGLALGAAAVFYSADLLAAATAAFGAKLLLCLVPVLLEASGTPRMGLIAALAVPVVAVLAIAVPGVLTGRTVSYEYEDLAPHVRRIVERERVKAEIDAANRIQRALLPPREPEFPGLALAAHYGAATEIGGDYYDFIPAGNGTLAIALGDVAGHGLTSGIVMSMVKSALLVQMEYDSNPVRVLQVLNDTLVRIAPRRMLMTFFFGLLDQDTGILRFSSAGHLDPYIFRSATGEIEPLSCWGLPLGVHRREPFRELTTRLLPNDQLVIFSDGLIEATNDQGDPFGFERFEALLRREGRRSVETLRAELLREINRFTRNRPPEDDQTLVILKFEGLRAEAA
ncbi:MAG: hypothetical protein DIJKHBIC_00650 [Thermoanaerobaculia bacterium]|nr:hypothetical protein [Thermoanaerobaculia bacterium]